MRRIKKLSNLEAYYIELGKAKPFSKLSNIERHNLEISEGFKFFLLRNIWTQVFAYSLLGIIAITIGMAIATKL